MEIKSQHIIKLVLLLWVGWVGYGQELNTTIQGSYLMKNINSGTAAITSPIVTFPHSEYTNKFELSNTSISGYGLFLGVGSDLILNKNIISTSISLGANVYEYGMKLTKTDSVSSIISDSLLTEFSDADIWKSIEDGGYNDFKTKKIYPTLNIGIGYKRELFRYKRFVPEIAVGFNFERRFYVTGDDTAPISENNSVGGDKDLLVYGMSENFRHRKLIISPYLGFNIRLSGGLLGVSYSQNLGRIDNGKGLLNFSEQNIQIKYAKTLGLTKIGKEQVVYGEYQHLGLSKSAEYRQGDKFSYISLGFGNKIFSNYDIAKPITETIYGQGSSGQDTLVIITNGSSLSSSIPFSVSFNTFATHRIMIGLGLAYYSEKYVTYGIVYDSSASKTLYTFDRNTPHTEEAALYRDKFDEASLAFSVSSAVYFSKRILKLDPYVRGTAAMVVDYNVPYFLAEDPKWRSTAFFPIYKIGLGVDFRIRIRSSKYFVIGLAGDYNLNPHANYTEVSLKLGYYRKKKLKNQRY